MQSDKSITDQITDLLELCKVETETKISHEMVDNYSDERLVVEKNKYIKQAVVNSLDKVQPLLTVEEERNELAHTYDIKITGYIFSKHNIVALLDLAEKFNQEKEDAGVRGENGSGGDAASNDGEESSDSQGTRDNAGDGDPQQPEPNTGAADNGGGHDLDSSGEAPANS